MRKNNYILASPVISTVVSVDWRLVRAFVVGYASDIKRSFCRLQGGQGSVDPDQTRGTGKLNRNESEETEEIKTSPPYPYLQQG